MAKLNPELPGGMHWSGPVVLAGIAVIGIYLYMHKRGIQPGTSFTIEDIGAGQGTRPSFGYGNPNESWDEAQTSQSFHKMPMSYGAYAASEPKVIQHGRRRPWYRFIDLTGYSQQPAYLEEQRFP